MHRFILLFLMCMLSFGSYYVYDNPAALERTIQNVRLGGCMCVYNSWNLMFDPR